ncbi:hypothetical protein I8J29_04295 [Paenibacillus sp. MWE-103]|uniref:Glycoside hydrolase family 38 central domain-containing protein n=1 Tax=Paenibacillus artemisiicola TaxID=1172618 RepID=A0ABS3W509_9BACL|nr:glycoside hydrolase family 38 C-terminal domain-containing protein [Paenibacillus artemisiicola]MBO7743402.1 hypothetical protein [Paenibacillus artemisiicola]
MSKAYFVDGYHGGIKGHMPLGSWADVLRRMRETPDWKLCLDIEPISWDALRRTDPASYAEVRRLIMEREKPRVEVVAASYAQPFGWVIGGESNIRQLIRGKALVEAHFPGIDVDTYATQEPCWSSSLPQILRSLGYKRAVLKNPGTAWGGYASGIDRETVLWVGPDGTAIPCVPRYACEELVNCWETEAGYMEPAFADKCVRLGIAHPVGSFLQDLGWPANPRHRREALRFVTWREYMDEIAEEPTEAWAFTQEDIRCTLPWGEGTLQRMSREVRAAENKIVAAEKLASVAGVLRGAAYPEARLQEAWDQLLLSQHHDAWICATTRTGREQWAWQAGAQSWMAEQSCDGVLDAALDSFKREARAGEAPGIRVFNLSGAERKEVAEIEIPASGAAASFRVRNGDGIEVPSQVVPTRARPDGTLHACKLLFEAETPAMGYRTYAVEPLRPEEVERSGGIAAEARAHAVVHEDCATIATDLYDIRIDTARGGVIASWKDKRLNREIVATGRAFNEFAGYLISERRWASSTEAPAMATIKENGPLRVVLELKGTFAGTGYVTTVTAAAGQRSVDFHVRFQYERDTWIGDPWEMAPEDRNTERRKSHHHTRRKLQARFPAALDDREIYKNSAFDVTLSRHADTHYERWDEIKHNIVLHWIDVYDPRRDYGLAVFADHATDYSHAKDEALALTLGWGGEGGFWWGKRPLNGVQEMRYAVLPHGGRWDRAGIQQACARWMEPLLPAFGFHSGASSMSLFRVTDPAIEVSSVTMDGEDLLVRLYNSGSEARSCSIVLGAPLSAGDLSLVELDGKPLSALSSDVLPDQTREAKLSLPRQGLATVRIGGMRTAAMNS